MTVNEKMLKKCPGKKRVSMALNLIFQHKKILTLCKNRHERHELQARVCFSFHFIVNHLISSPKPGVTADMCLMSECCFSPSQPKLWRLSWFWSCLNASPLPSPLDPPHSALLLVRKVWRHLIDLVLVVQLYPIRNSSAGEKKGVEQRRDRSRFWCSDIH